MNLSTTPLRIGYRVPATARSGDEATRQIGALSGIVQPTIIALTASALRGDRECML